MSAALDSLDGLADGTDVAIIVNERVQRWKALDGGLVQEGVGTRLDPWFFIGYLNAGQVMLGHFAPPQVGEWWTTAGDWGHLVVEAAAPLCTAATFRRDQFYEWRIDRNLLDEGYLRTEAPAWVSAQVLSMTRLAYRNHSARLEAEQKVRHLHDAKYNLAYAKDYLDQAVRHLEGNR